MPALNCFKVMPSTVLSARMRLLLRTASGIGAQSIDPRSKRRVRIRHLMATEACSASSTADSSPIYQRSHGTSALISELRGRELPDREMRRIAERAWHNSLRYGWPTHGQ